MNSTLPTSPVGLNVRIVTEFTGRTHQQQIVLVAADSVGGTGGLPDVEPGGDRPTSRTTRITDIDSAHTAVTKISVSLEEETLAAARIAAEEAGLSLSAWLSQAAQHAATLAAGRAAVREYDAEAGAFTQEEIARADQILDELGVQPAAW